jgi:hypothetical protein
MEQASHRADAPFFGPIGTGTRGGEFPKTVGSNAVPAGSMTKAWLPTGSSRWSLPDQSVTTRPTRAFGAKLQLSPSLSVCATPSSLAKMTFP